MPLDIAAIRERLDAMHHHYDNEDEVEFALAAFESLGACDIENLLAEVARLNGLVNVGTTGPTEAGAGSWSCSV